MLKKQPHLFIPTFTERSRYKGSGGGSLKIPPRMDRKAHADRLIEKFNSIRSAFKPNADSYDIQSVKTSGGTYLEFIGVPDYDFPIKSLEDKKAKIRLAHSSLIAKEGGNSIRAIVYVPRGSEKRILDKLIAYRDKTNAQKKNGEQGSPKHASLVASIEEIETAALNSLWQDPIELMPNSTPLWCEIWLRDIDESQDVVVASTHAILNEIGAVYSKEYSSFRETVVIHALVNRQQLTDFIYSSAYLSEYRIAQGLASIYWDKNAGVEASQASQLVERVIVNDKNVTIAILDSGVNNGHVLLQPVLEDADCLTYKAEWGTEDHEGGDGHGTPMAGLATYKNLTLALQSSHQVELFHKLLSVKIFPKQNDTEERNYGPYTLGSMALAEGQLVGRNVVYCMAVTTDFDIDHGRPSSWSADIDDHISGRLDGQRRLVIISAGNFKGNHFAYPEENKQYSIRNPGQSWNAITVGAFTELDQIIDPRHLQYTPIARRGQLSPFTSTSVLWKEKNKWPNKPDIVFEGGNVAADKYGAMEDIPDLNILTTSKDFQNNQFALINATSAASAQAAWMAARLYAEYPNAWPETIRCLIVHSAEWNDEVIAQFNVDLKSKASIANLLRIVGYGIPNLEKALFSAGNYLTIVAEQEIQPFGKFRNPKGVLTNTFSDIHYFDLKWPSDILQDLGAVLVKLKVTLSYFVEPSPENIGHSDRYRYPSHALRFRYSKPNEEFSEFKARVNKALRDEESNMQGTSSSKVQEKWTIGSDNRNLGSIHSDFVYMTAAELAACHFVSVHPIGGWWYSRPNLNSVEKITRYSLIVSIETPEQEIDIYSPIAISIRTEI